MCFSVLFFQLYAYEKFNGVSWDPKLKKWIAHLYHDGNFQHCGYFDTEVEAAVGLNQCCDSFGIERMNNEVGVNVFDQRKPTFFSRRKNILFMGYFRLDKKKINFFNLQKSVPRYPPTSAVILLFSPIWSL